MTSEHARLGKALGTLATSADLHSLRAGFALDVTAPVVLAITSILNVYDLRRKTSSAAHRLTTSRTFLVFLALPKPLQ